MSYEINDDSYPASAVCYIEARWGSQYFTGTGFLVGDNDVVTASHVIYNSALGGIPDEVRIYPSYDPDALDNRFFRPVWFQYYNDFDPDSDGFLYVGDFSRPTGAGTEIDIALLTLDQSIGSVYGYFGIDSTFKSGSVAVIGYPSIYGRQPMFDSGSAVKSPIDNSLYIAQDLEINSGNSGGPIFYQDGNGVYAVGVVSTSISATSLSAHYTWLTEAISENNRFLQGYTPDPTYVFLDSPSRVSEGSSLTLELQTTDVPAGPFIFTISGIDIYDIEGSGVFRSASGILTGETWINEDGRAFIELSVVNDALREGTERLTISAGSATTSIDIVDTSSYVSGPSVVIKTNFGEITVELFPEAAPKSVSNFLQYAFDDYYDNVLFHRVVNDFVIQAGLFNSEGNAKTPSLRAAIELESSNGLSNVRGTIGMARTDSENSATSQFYFNLVDNTSLDYRSASAPGYAVFGQVTSGLSVIDAISDVPVATNSGFENVPVSPVVIMDVELSSAADQLFSLQTFVAAEDVSSARLDFTTDEIRLKEMSDGAWAVLETGGWSIAKLVGYERVLLNDRVIGLDHDGVGGQAYRIYKAAFDRDPMEGDTAGLGFWITQMDSGMDMVEVAARFIDSPEFRSLYGQNPTSGEFLNKVYLNVLDRLPDDSGYAWWIDQLANNPEKSWEKVLADFSESPENQANVAELIAGGIYYDPWVG